MFEEEDRREISSDKEGILMDLADSRLYLKVLSVMKKADIESSKFFLVFENLKWSEKKSFSKH